MSFIIGEYTKNALAVHEHLYSMRYVE